MTVACVQAFETSTLETTTRTHVVDRFLLHMPEPVTAEGSTHGVEGGVWVARGPKVAEAPLVPSQI